ncbi:hypothetical protein [Deinococcus sp. NW-56]|uniref:hypothetical protein n=1 Tax=Deinococcus sp. NW-56 TaxID=2080419 RepID=UPI000CF3D920|nr:hypothetical protein [Deinococcus sp. NW-56]
MTLERLRADLARYDVRLSLGSGGKLRYDAASDLPADVLDAMRAHKAALLADLQRGQGTRPDWEALSRERGRCGSCARWTPAPEWGALMGECAAGRLAHGWYDGNPRAPVIVHTGHKCAAWGGEGYRPGDRA